jgi:signal transduction histidine kinase
MLYRRFLGKQLGDEPLEIYEATSGAEGCELFASLRPDCVLLDHNLLDTDGLTVLDELKQLTPPDTLCAIMITGSGSETLAVRALTNGALDYLVKQQFDRELLGKTVRHAIEKNEWRQYVAGYHTELQAANQQLRDSLTELTAARVELHEKNDQLSAANAEIEARNQQLARSNADLDNFVYAASHDLKQPVNNLRGLFDLLRQSATFSDPDAPQVLRLVDDSLQALAATITDLSMVVQQNRQPYVQAAEPVALGELTAEVVQALRPQLLETQADIQTDFAFLPVLRYVPGNLRTIVLNLVANAIKYRHPARPPQVALRTYQAAGGPILEVRDNGLGIDLALHGTELFQLFRRFHPQVASGTGVGLFLVNRLVQANGGHLEVESEVGVGTTFRVYLG